MVQHSLIVLILLAVVLAGCRSGTKLEANSASDSESAKAAINALGQEWEKHFEARDAAALASLFTDDCVRMPDGGAITNGKVALEAAYRREYANLWKTKFDASLRTDEVVISGDYAFARGRESLIRYESDKTFQEFGKWMATYRRQPDGSWKYLWITNNRDH